MFEDINAALESEQFHLDDGELNAVFEDASFEFNCEDGEMIAFLAAQEGLERDLESLDSIQAVLESDGATEGLMKFINVDNKFGATIGVDIPVVTTENAAAVSQACLEGIKTTIVKVWETIKRWFAGMIIRVKAWFKRILSFRGALEKKLYSAKALVAKYDGFKSGQGWLDKEMSGYSKKDFENLIGETMKAAEAAAKLKDSELTGEVSMPAELRTFASTVLGTDYSEDTNKNGQYKTKAVKGFKGFSRTEGKVGKLGWDLGSIKNAINDAYLLVSGNLKKMEGLETKLVKQADTFVKEAEKNMAAAQAKKDTKDVKAARKAAKRLGQITSITTAIYRKGIECGNFALVMANKIPQND